MNKHLHELIIDHHSGKVSSTKVMAIPAAVVAAFCVIWETTNGRLSDWLFWAYIAVYSGSPIMSNFIATKWGKGGTADVGTASDKQNTGNKICTMDPAVICDCPANLGDNPKCSAQIQPSKS